jgi:hypothetical protein
MKKLSILLYLAAAAVAVLCARKFLVNRAARRPRRPPDESVIEKQNGLRRIERNGKWALFDKSGKALTAFEYDIIESFHEGRAVAIKGRKHGFIDADGRVAAPFIYDMAFPFKGGLALVGAGGKWGFVGLDGREAIKTEWDVITPFDRDGIARAEKRNPKKTVLFDRSGNIK